MVHQKDEDRFKFFKDIKTNQIMLYVVGGKDAAYGDSRRDQGQENYFGNSSLGAGPLTRDAAGTELYELFLSSALKMLGRKQQRRIYTSKPDGLMQVGLKDFWSFESLERKRIIN